MYTGKNTLKITVWWKKKKYSTEIYTNDRSGYVEEHIQNPSEAKKVMAILIFALTRYSIHSRVIDRATNTWVCNNFM